MIRKKRYPIRHNRLPMAITCNQFFGKTNN